MAFELSCDRLLQKLFAFLHVHSDTATEKKKLERWMHQNAEILGVARQHQFDFWGRTTDEEDDDIVLEELLERPSSTSIARSTTFTRLMPRPTWTSIRSFISWSRPEVRAEARRQAAEAHPPVEDSRTCRPESADLHRIRGHCPVPEASTRSRLASKALPSSTARQKATGRTSSTASRPTTTGRALGGAASAARPRFGSCDRPTCCPKA